jgi:hypothetical protein
MVAFKRSVGRIPPRAMAARVEDGVVIFLLHALEAHRLVDLSFGVGILLENGDPLMKRELL